MTGVNIKEMADDFVRHEQLHPIDFGGHKRVMGLTVIWLLYIYREGYHLAAFSLNIVIGVHSIVILKFVSFLC